MSLSFVSNFSISWDMDSILFLYSWNDRDDSIVVSSSQIEILSSLLFRLCFRVLERDLGDVDLEDFVDELFGFDKDDIYFLVFL